MNILYTGHGHGQLPVLTLVEVTNLITNDGITPRQILDATRTYDFAEVVKSLTILTEEEIIDFDREKGVYYAIP